MFVFVHVSVAGFYRAAGVPICSNHLCAPVLFLCCVNGSFTSRHAELDGMFPAFWMQWLCVIQNGLASDGDAGVCVCCADSNDSYVSGSFCATTPSHHAPAGCELLLLQDVMCFMHDVEKFTFANTFMNKVNARRDFECALIFLYNQ